MMTFHRMKSAALVCAAAVALTACGQGGIQLAEPSDETYQAVPYQLYPTSEGAWVGDVMPLVDNGKLELYYLYDTDHNGQAYHPIYRFTTENLYEYQDDGEAIPYGNFGDPDLALGTGSVLLGQDGLYHCFYTGHNEGNASPFGPGKECVMHAVSSDKVTWTKLPEDTFYAPENYSTDDFRDPEVFWNEDEQCYWMLVAAHENTLGGVVVKYTSTDLSNWTFCGPIFAPQAQYMLECPDLFEINGRWYLTYSWDCTTYYAIGDSMDGPFTVPEDNTLDGNNFVFYAPKTAELNGHRYLCGWIGRNFQEQDVGMYQWAGSLLIHELIQQEDGRLGICAPETLENYFTETQPVQAVGTAGSVSQEDGAYQLKGTKEPAVIDLDMRKPTFTLTCDVTLDGSGCAGFAFGQPGEDYSSYTGLALDTVHGCLRYEGAALTDLVSTDPMVYTTFDFQPGVTHHLKIVAENEILILYIDDQKALSSRVYNSIDGAHLCIFASGMDAVFENLSLSVPA